MALVGMNHFTVLTDDLPRTRAFYVGLLGLSEGPRPDFGFPGAWLYADGAAVLHVIARESLPEERCGVLDHMAFSATGLNETLRRLGQAGVEYQVKRLPNSGVWQVFFFDPNGARVELDFAASEEGPSATL